MKFNIASVACSLLVFWGAFFGSINIVNASDTVNKPLIDFSDASIKNQWVSVNDNVMGGVSEGSFTITDEKTLVFSGNLSLENRGGFASIRTKPTDLNMDGYDTIAIRVKGDGRTYYVNLMTSYGRSIGSYRSPVKTQKGVWQEFRIPLEDFVYTAFGRLVTNSEPLRAEKVQSLGFTLSDKQAGPFRLEVDWIKAEKGPYDSLETMDIVDTAVSAGQFGTLVTAVKAAGLVDALKSKGPFTVFAPNDDAFAKLPQGTVEKLLEPSSREELRALLSYHVVAEKILLGDQSLATLQGESLNITTDGNFEVNGAKVIATNIIATNGVIHVIDTVLTSPLTKLPSREAARSVIGLAIERGVPLFNAGQHSACAAIYEVAIESLMKSHSDALSETNRSELQAALRKMQDETSPREKAWTLRRALDSVYESLAED